MGYYADEAKKAEYNSDWWEAVRLWKLDNSDYGREQAEVCKRIAESIDLGDAYRELTAGSHQRWEKHEINNRELHEIQRNAHERVYGKGV